MGYIIPQSFDVSTSSENTYKVFARMRKSGGSFGRFYTSTYDSADPYGDSQYGTYLPDPYQSVSIHYVYDNDLVGGGLENQCYTGPDANRPDCREDNPITDIFNYQACCIRTFKIRTCPSNDLGSSPRVTFETTFGFPNEEYPESDWSGCDNPGGEIVIGGGVVDNNDEPWIWQIAPFENFPDWINNDNTPYPTSNSSVAEEAGYTTDRGIVIGGATADQRFTILENGTFRRENVYCSHIQTNYHMGAGAFECTDALGTTNPTLYGTWSQSNPFQIVFTENEHPSYGESTIYYTQASESDEPNEYGNPCRKLSGIGTRYWGDQFTWTSTSCVGWTDDESDVGFDFQIPQGDGNFTENGTPYNGLQPTHGMKILKSLPHEEHGLWFDRTMSIYYLASDGRFMTVQSGGSANVGVYELNRKDETLKIIGLNRGAKCKDSNQNDANQYTELQSCIDAGYRWYTGGNSMIEMDGAGFQDGMVTGTYKTAWIDYVDLDGEHTDDSQIGEILSLPVLFDSTQIFNGKWGDGDATFYINGDDEHKHITYVRHSGGGSTANHGFDMVRSLVGQIGQDPNDTTYHFNSAHTPQNDFPCSEDHPSEGHAWGGPSWKMIYGYGYDTKFANGEWNPNDDECTTYGGGQYDQQWKRKQFGHRFRFEGIGANELNINTDNPDLFYDPGMINSNQSGLGVQWFSPSAPCYFNPDLEGLPCVIEATSDEEFWPVPENGECPPNYENG